MYIDAEERKKELMAQNEMNGLMFKMEDDPRDQGKARIHPQDQHRRAAAVL